MPFPVYLLIQFLVICIVFFVAWRVLELMKLDQGLSEIARLVLGIIFLLVLLGFIIRALGLPVLGW